MLQRSVKVKKNAGTSTDACDVVTRGISANLSLQSRSKHESDFLYLIYAVLLSVTDTGCKEGCSVHIAHHKSFAIGHQPLCFTPLQVTTESQGTPLLGASPSQWQPRLARVGAMFTPLAVPDLQDLAAVVIGLFPSKLRLEVHLQSKASEAVGIEAVGRSRMLQVSQALVMKNCKELGVKHHQTTLQS